MKYCKPFDEMTTLQQEEFLKKYEDDLLSIGELAKLGQTYPNKIRRALIKNDFALRTKSEAQKIALQTQRHKHPTKGVGHSQQTKEQLSNTMSQVWEDMPQKQKEQRCKKAKQIWNQKSDDEKQAFHQKGGDAIRETARDGSKLEKYLCDQLLREGYEVDYHTKHRLANELLHIDLLLPTLRIAIEVDGPSHFQPVWGEDNLQKTLKTDNQKNGLILGQGLCLIRIRHSKSPSWSTQRKIWNKLLSIIQSIEQQFPKPGKRFTMIGA
jgi:very-short-patch-repair endonuclease